MKKKKDQNLLEHALEFKKTRVWNRFETEAKREDSGSQIETFCRFFFVFAGQTDLIFGEKIKEKSIHHIMEYISLIFDMTLYILLLRGREI